MIEFLGDMLFYICLLTQRSFAPNGVNPEPGLATELRRDKHTPPSADGFFSICSNSASHMGMTLSAVVSLDIITFYHSGWLEVL